MVNRAAYLLAFLAVAIGAQVTPTVSNLTTDQLTHSTMQLLFNVAGPYVAYRVRYIASPGTCAGGTGGTVQINGTASSTLVASGMTADISGLAPSTAYNVCVEVSPDNASWSSGVSAKFTTLALPSPHPALPIAPTTFDTSYPNTSGFTVINTTCANYQNDLNTAVANQLSNGTVIQIPAGSICLTGTMGLNDTYWITPVPPDVKSFQATNINTASGLITITGHGFTNNQEVRLATSGCLMNSAGSDPFCQLRGILKGEPYYAQVVDANNFYLMNAPGGSVITYTDPGTGTQYIAGFPRALYPVIVRTSTPDAQFTPAGVRTSPAWQPKMASLVLNTVGGAFWNVTQGFGFLAANIRFMGIEFTHGDNSAEVATTNDPQPWNGLIETEPDSSSIVLDRCYVHGLGFPNRLYRTFYGFDGHNNAIVNSYLNHLDYWHSVFTGLGVTQTSPTQFTIASGTHHMGAIAPVLLNTATINFSGGSGTAMVYYDMSGNFTVNFPPSVTPGSCTGTGIACTVLNTQGATNGSCNDTDAWPKNANGRTAAGEIACVTIASGAITSVAGADAFSSANDTEGASSFIAGYGPGPWAILNNYFSGTGIIMHFDDSGDGEYTRGDYLIQRNTYNTPFYEMFGGPVSNGLRYGHRQPLEWKGGSRIKVDGNIFDGSWIEDTASAVFIAITPRAGGIMNDVDITNNTFQHGPGGLNLPQPVDSYAPVSKPVLRIRAKNNLLWDINGWNYHTGLNSPALGWIFIGGYGNEDVILDHNTAYDNRGTEGSFMHWDLDPTEGMWITNNFIFDSGIVMAEESLAPCVGLFDAAMMNCAFTAGPGNAAYTFAGNVIVPSWTNSSLPSGQGSQSSIQTNFSGLTGTNPVLSSSLGGVAQTVASVGWFNPASTSAPDFHLNASSAEISGGAHRATDGTDVGANIDALHAAQGKVTLIGVPNSSITTAAANVVFVAPDSAGCSVDFSNSDPTITSGFTRATDAGGARVHAVALSGLSSGTTYYYRVNCAVEQPTGQFRTH